MSALAVAQSYPIDFRTEEGTSLCGTIYEIDESARPCVLIGGALGVTQRFYAPFASWLAGRGRRVLTYDPSGIGASRQPRHRNSLRGLTVDMMSWAQQDFAAAVRTLVRRSEDGSIAMIGHSLGTHMAGLTDRVTQSRVSRVVSVAAGAGSWRDWADASRRKAPLMLHVAGPLLTPLFGYFPGRRLRMVGDLPRPVMKQWSRWCRHPEFAFGADPALVLPGFRRANFPIHALSFTDDEAMTLACTRRLLAEFTQSPSTLRVVAPAELGLSSIGHLGAFRPEMETSVWPLVHAALVQGHC